MTKQDFAAVMAYIAAGCGKQLDKAGLRVYYDLLGDLPLEALQLAAKRALLEQTYAVFPQVGTLRRLAAEAMAPTACVPAVEAWGLVRRAIRTWGYARGEEALASLPPVVRRAVECLGWRELCDATCTEIVRAQFERNYTTLLQREERERLLPQSVTALLEAVADQKQLTSSRSAG